MTDTYTYEWSYNEAYDIGKRHAIESLSFFDIISLIEKKNFTCDQLNAIKSAVEDMKWSDYETDDRLGEDLTESLREQRWEFDRV